MFIFPLEQRALSSTWRLVPRRGCVSVLQVCRQALRAGDKPLPHEETRRRPERRVPNLFPVRSGSPGAWKPEMGRPSTRPRVGRLAVGLLLVSALVLNQFWPTGREFMVQQSATV